MNNNHQPKVHIKLTAIVVAFTFMFQMFFPSLVFATGGVSGQAENRSFSGSGTSNMVNLFTGDLNYSIPLLDIEGYPLTLSYNGGVGMNTDASWVGLGWDCSPGFINREMRGLPDDFNKDQITQSINIKTEEEGKVGVADYHRSAYSIPFVGASWSKSHEEGYNSISSLYDGNDGYENFTSETHTKGDHFSDNGTTKSTLYNSFHGFSLNETTFNKDKDFSFLPGMMSSESTSRTHVFNSRAGLTHIVNGAGKGSEFSMGGLGVMIEVVLTVFSFGSYEAGTVLKSISDIGSIASMIQPSMSSSSNGSSVITTGTPTYTPSVSLETFRASADFESRSGQGFLFWTGGWIDKTKGTKFSNINGVKSTPANGYLNSTSFLYNSLVNTKNLYDLNRENDGVYYETMPNLPVTNATHDVYHVRSNGVNADYRAFRNDVGSYHTPYSESMGKSFGLTGLHEYNLFPGSYTKSTTISQSKTKSGTTIWGNPENKGPQNLQFTDGITETEYEPYYFKNIGEKVSYNSTFYDMYGGDQPALVKYLQSPYFEASIINIFKYEYNPLFGVATDAKLEVKNPNGTYFDVAIPSSRNPTTLKNKREYRNDLFIEKKANENTALFIEPTINDYVEYDEILNPGGTITLSAATARNTLPSNHTSEIVVQNDQGGKYIYGIPVYNNAKKQTSFNVTGRTVDATNELVTYAAPDNSMSNSNGYNNYFSSVETPKYATAYLLTSIINDSYIDLTGNGLTEDDHGGYTKFNYSKVHNNYSWRSPYGANQANFTTLHHAYSNDEKGSYTYGEKEIWYTHSIETKNYIAEFYLSDRQDGYSVAGENGGIGTSKLKKLDKIKLFAKEERLKKGAAAVPIKTVHFTYDYSLCTGTPSNIVNDGKLTLKEVYFTYGNSDKGKESIYQFSYADFDNDGTQDINYPYSESSTDRWGTYKPNSAALLNSEFPFADQSDRLQADKYAAAWQLSQIKTPEGSVIKIYYEADDYAYVQNKRAMQMFKIEGTDLTVNNSFDPGSMTPNNTLYDSYTTSNNIIYFKLQENITTGTKADAEEFIQQNYLKDIEHLYFKSFVELGNAKEEYVEGYAKILNSGVVGGSTAPYSYGWIELDPNFFNGYNNSYYSGSNTNPIAKAGWQALRLNVPRVYRDLTTYSYDLSVLNSSINGSVNPDIIYKNRALANQIDLSKSWIRLVNPNQQKIGGGVRVNKVTASDSWGSMGGNSDEVYGSTYEYSKEDVNGDMVSTGVAAYEPFMGNEENPWRTPVFYVKENRQFPNDYLYQETPFGESHFPSPVVGYSSVKVKNIPRSGVTLHATGYSVNKFYTSKDFPTIIDKTKKSVGKFAYTPSNSQLVIGVPTIDHSFASQGFVIVKNDMHGQNEGSEIYNEGGSLISKSTIYYKSDLLGGDSYRLNNTATIINKDGTKSDVTIGKDIDIYNSYRESFDEDAFTSKTNGRNYSLFSLYGLLGKFKSKSISKSSKRLYTTVFTKVINQYGLVDRVETEDLGTKSVLRNLAYDGETGNLLLTSVKNEFSDEIFKFQYPAHWHYDDLGQAYKNASISLTNLTSPLSPHNGIINLNATSIEYFKEGDKLLISYDAGPVITEQAWVLEVDKINNQITCIDDDGTLIPFTIDPISLKVIQSGRNNMQNMPIGTVLSLTNPIAGSSLSFSNVIQSSAIELSDDWTTICEPGYLDIKGYAGTYESYSLTTPGLEINPYVAGIKGKWKVEKTYSYNQTRDLIATASTTEVRTDGSYTSFKPFWDFNSSGELVAINDLTYPLGDGTYEKWKLNMEMTRYGKDGNLEETKDILDRYATTLYGYSPTLKNIPVAIASNAEQKQIACDGFEDYEYFNDPSFTAFPGHFNFSKNSTGLVTDEESHTGEKSIKIIAETNHYMGKSIVANCDGLPLFNTSEINNYLTEYCDCEQQFSPAAGKYIISAWVKQSSAIPGMTITDGRIRIEQAASNVILPGLSVSLYPSGPVIEGWQRIEGEVNIDISADAVIIVLENTGSGVPPVYFDDVRFHPFNSAMKTMVYQPDNLRLMAELDNKNYATFFEFDEEGTLVRIKKETERGIVTIKETRSSIVKN